MRDYGKVAPQFWTGPTGKLIRQAGADAQRVALYLITGPSANMLGLYYLPLPTLCHEVGIDAKSARQAISDLSACGFAYYDGETEHVFVPEMVRFQVSETLAANDNRRIAVVRELEVKRGHCPVFAELFLDRYRVPLNLTVPIYPPTQSHERIPKDLLAALYRRDEGSCRGCQGVKDIQIDHVVPKILGGETVLENLQLLCASCNAKKSASDRKTFWDNHFGTVSRCFENGSERGHEGVPQPLRSQEQEQEHEQEQKEYSASESKSDSDPPPAFTSIASKEKLTPLASTWNQMCTRLPAVQEVSTDRRRREKARLKEHPLGWWQEVFKAVNESSFLTGENDRGWRCDYDWMIRNGSNALKVLEGRYCNKGNGRGSKPTNARSLETEQIALGAE